MTPAEKDAAVLSMLLATPRSVAPTELWMLLWQQHGWRDLSVASVARSLKRIGAVRHPGGLYSAPAAPAAPAIGGMTHYPANWRELIAEVRKRAGGHCEGSPAFPDCGAVHGEPHPVTGCRVVLTTGHLDPRPERAGLSNLRHWCQRCRWHCDLVGRAEREHPSPAQRLATAEFLRAVGADA